MTGRIDPASAVAKHVIKTPLTVDKRRALRHSKGKVSQDKLAGLPRPARSAQKGGANLPAELNCTLTSVRGSGPTGTCIPIATKDGAKTAPDFLRGTRDQKLTPEERNECESAPPTGGALSGELAEFGDVFNGIACMSLDQLKQRREQRQEEREKSGQVLRRNLGRKNLLGPAQATDKASAEATPVAKPRKTSRRAPNPKEPPPSYAAHMGVHSASEAFSLKRINKLPSNPDPVEHREELLALARHVAGQLQSAPADSKLSAIRDICYAMIRELKKPEPDLSESACGWLVARGKELASKQPKTDDFKPLYVRNDQPALKPFTSIDGGADRAEKNRQQKESYARFQPNRQAFASALDKRSQLKAALEKRIAPETLQSMKTQNLVPDSNPR